MPLLSTHLPPLHWALSGAGIAAVTLLLLYVGNRRLGLSSGLDDVCGLALHTPYFSQASLREGRVWRLPFLVGLLLGGALSVLFAGQPWVVQTSTGMLDAALHLGPLAKTGWMFGGGVLIGCGTRMANGCTSGHGIFGMSNLEGASMASTVTFMAFGIATTQVLYRVVFHGAGL